MIVVAKWYWQSNFDIINAKMLSFGFIIVVGSKMTFLLEKALVD